MAKLKGLGRGLDSLLSSSSDDLDNPVKLIELNKLFSGKTQPRKSFNDQSLESLSESIKSSGIMQPIVVRKTQFDDKYEIIAGERRWRAAGIANLKKVPVIVRKVDDKKSLVLSLIENIQREDLNAVEEAEAINKLITNYNFLKDNRSREMNNKLVRVQNKAKRLNLKNKRKRNLIKKAIELSEMLDMDMCIVFKDRDTDNITQYMSGGSRRELFTIERAIAEIQAWTHKQRNIKSYNDDDYNKFVSLSTDLTDVAQADPLSAQIDLAPKFDQSMVANQPVAKCNFEPNSLSLDQNPNVTFEKTKILKRQRQMSLSEENACCALPLL